MNGTKHFLIKHNRNTSFRCSKLRSKARNKAYANALERRAVGGYSSHTELVVEVACGVTALVLVVGALLLLYWFVCRPQRQNHSSTNHHHPTGKSFKSASKKSGCKSGNRSAKSTKTRSRRSKRNNGAKSKKSTKVSNT